MPPKCETLAGGHTMVFHFLWNGRLARGTNSRNMQRCNPDLLLPNRLSLSPLPCLNSAGSSACSIVLHSWRFFLSTLFTTLCLLLTALMA